MQDSDRYQKKIILIFTAVAILMFFLVSLIGCTISFQNISTHGTATDLVDETQSPTNDVKPNLVIPLKPGI